MRSLYDFIIVGSGASGSTLAYYLTKAGARCLLIEAGKDYKPQEYPSNELDANTSLMWNGGMNATDDAGLLLLRGKCVGGGTVINQCLLDPFDDQAFDQWRAASNIEFFSSGAMAKHYHAVESQLQLHHFKAAEMNGNAKLFVKGMEQEQFNWKFLRRGQSRCNIHKNNHEGSHADIHEEGNDCIVCLGGCPRESKQSMTVTFLPKALQQGLELQSEFEVKHITHGERMVTVSGVRSGVHGKGKQQTKLHFYGKRCILAGGAIGSTELMLRSGYQSLLPQLGRGFYCHPQVMNIGFFDEPVDAHKGALQSVKSADDRFRQKRFKLENVFAGPIAIALLNPQFGMAHQQYMRRYRHMACIEVAIRDVQPGAIRLNNAGRLKIAKPLGDEDKQSIKAGVEVINNMLTAAGAREIMQSPVNLGLHLMGGCAIGTAPGNSVVNSEFQVHGLRNLYIADSAIFPQATGINPSLSIMALAHRASQSLLQAAGFTSQIIATQPQEVTA